MAGRLFGVASAGNAAPPAIAGFKVQTSVYGLPIPIVYGQARVAGNLIQMYQFPPIEQRSQGHSSKLFKVDSQVTGYLYKGAVALALAEGPIAGIGKVWRDKDAADTWANYQTKFGWSLFLGTSTQAPWAWLTSNHPADAVPYQLTAYVANPSLELPNDVLSNYTWEVLGIAPYGAGVVDANPKDVVTDVLTNADHGVGFPAAQLGDLSAYSNYCIAAGLFLSPVLNGQSPLTDQLSELADATNSAFVWSDGQLKLVPYGDSALTGHAVTYTPNVTPLYDLTDDDFQAPAGTDPIVITRKKPSDCFNQVSVEYEDRAHDYNPNVQEAKDQASIDAYGLRPAPAVRFAAIKDAATARFIAQLRLQRELNVRNTYQFTLSMKYALLEPMDLVTLTDAGLGLDHVAVRLTTIEEDEDGNLTCTAEDFPAGIATASRYGAAGANGYAPATNTPPGSTVAPAIFEGPGPLASSALEIWIAASGGTNWGGCDVWMSTDNVNFQRVASITRKATYGVLTAALASAPASPPNDTTHTLAVDVSSSAGALAGGSASDLAAMVTLSLVENEFLAYQGAALTSAYQYNLTTLARGLFGSAIPASHAIGAPFVRCDDALLRLPFPQGTNGQVVYFKFPAFNTFGQALEDVATVTSYAHTIGKNTVTTGGAGIVGAPRASLDFVTEDEFEVVLALSGTLGSGAWGDLQYRTRIGSGSWSAWSSSHADWTVLRAPKLTKLAQLQVLQADGQVSQVATYPVTGSLAGVDVGTGNVDPTQPLAGPIRYIPRATDVSGMTLDSGTMESQGKEIRRLFAKPLFGDPDTLDANIDGLLYGRPKLTALTGGEVDLSKAGVINRHLGNIADGGGFNRVAAADMSGNRVAVLHVGDTRNTNAPPSSYSQGVTNEFKDAGAIGIPGFSPLSGVFGNLRTEKPWTDSSGGFATQTWAGSDGRVWKREAPAGGASWPNPWRILTEVQTQRFDRATGHLTDDMQTSGGREVRRLLAKGLADDPDTLDATGLDGLNFKRTTVAQVGYADRAGVGLDSSGYLQSGVRNAATVAGLSAALLSRRSGALFVETYDVLPQNNGWAISGVGGWSAVLQSDTNSTMGRNCLITTNYTVQSWGTPIPINPNKLYRLRARVRTIQYHAEGAANTVWYIGVIESNYHGDAANANSGACYCVAESANPGLGGFVEYVGWMKGCTTPYATTSGLAGGTAAAPAAWNVGTVAIQPYILAGYPNGGAGIGGQFMVDYFLIDEFDEDGTFRTYTGLSEGGDVKGLMYTPGGSRRIVRGGKSGVCRHTDVVTFPATTNLPAVILEGGVNHQPESKWGTMTQVDSGVGATNAPTAGKAQYRDFAPDNLTNSSFTTRARLRIKGGTGTQSYDYAANSVSSVNGDTGAVTLAAGASSNGQYTTRYDITVNCTCLNPTGTSTFTVVVAIDVDDGSGTFFERASISYAASADAGAGSASSVNNNQSAVVSATVTGTPNPGRIRIRVKSATLSGVKGSGTFTLHGHTSSDSTRGVTYSTSVGDQYTSATPDTDDGAAIAYTVVEI